MIRGLSIALLLMGTMATMGAALASVPPPGWKQPVFEGPGLFCGVPFNIELAAGEKVMQGWPSTTPIYSRYDFQLRDGELIVRARPSDFPQPTKYFRKQRLKRVAGGHLYRFRGLRDGNGDYAAVSGYVMLPDDDTTENIEFLYYNDKPLIAPSAFKSIMDRMQFSSEKPPNCLLKKEVPI